MIPTLPAEPQRKLLDNEPGFWSVYQNRQHFGDGSAGNPVPKGLKTANEEQSSAGVNAVL